MSRRAVGRRGQSLTEFALVVPLLLFMLLGVVDAGLLMFSVGTASQAVGEGARVGAEAGNASTADSQIVTAIKGTALGSTTLVQVTEIDIYHLLEAPGPTPPQGTLYVDNTCSGPCLNKYKLDGTLIGSVVWASTSRNVTYGSTDFLGVTIKYTYQWKSGVLLSATALQLTSVYYVRLEPQTY